MMATLELLTLADVVSLALFIIIALIFLSRPQDQTALDDGSQAPIYTGDPLPPLHEANARFVGPGQAAAALAFLDPPTEFRANQPADLPLLADPQPFIPTGELNPHMLPFRRWRGFSPAPGNALFYAILALLLFVPLLLRLLN